MITLYAWPTPNAHKVSIMLAECALDFEVVTIDITAGDQFKPEFLAISPNNRMPAIIDHEGLGGGDPLFAPSVSRDVRLPGSDGCKPTSARQEAKGEFEEKGCPQGG